ncbi:16S rRNA (guanine(527)-N(7))-methyltransferase RsmG [Dehalogenimonas sp. THU2]|uniref:16S rRNA (guanine(527)-N(7))-methyltransferase RsmG n=1 Tax=Dehalogenimonas sp. THU2 TaxID=3151121 RepID=UPI00321839C8
MFENLPLLRRGATGLGLSLDESRYDLFETYYRELIDWNARFNLTAVTDYDGVQVTHFLDSLSLAVAGIGFDNHRVIDVGSGAGFPGLPLKIAFPGIELTLLEAIGKKAVFLSHMAGILGLDGVSVVNLRAEEAARQPEHRESYDIAVSRAVASLDTLCELTLPFCRVGGWFIAMKKGSIEDEVESARKGIALLGGCLRDVRAIEIDGLSDDRRLIVIEKISPTPESYPRRNGLPSKRPLR